MRTIEKTVFIFDELTDDAKEKAREWWRNCEISDMGDLLDRDDIEEIAKILGIKFDTQPVQLMNGKTRSKVRILYSGFYSQGDGASWEGGYSYAKGATKAIRAYAPLDKDLHKISDNLQAIQRRYFYRVSANVTQSGYYCHSRTMRCDVSVNDNDAPESVRENVQDLMRQFADWIYSQLEKEYEYRLSDENVDESIRINEYEFYESGEIA